MYGAFGRKNKMGGRSSNTRATPSAPPPRANTPQADAVGAGSGGMRMYTPPAPTVEPPQGAPRPPREAPKPQMSLPAGESPSAYAQTPRQPSRKMVQAPSGGRITRGGTSTVDARGIVQGGAVQLTPTRHKAPNVPRAGHNVVVKPKPRYVPRMRGGRSIAPKPKPTPGRQPTVVNFGRDSTPPVQAKPHPRSRRRAPAAAMMPLAHTPPPVQAKPQRPKWHRPPPRAAMVAPTSAAVDMPVASYTASGMAMPGPTPVDAKAAAALAMTSHAAAMPAPMPMPVGPVYPSLPGIGGQPAFNAPAPKNPIPTQPGAGVSTVPVHAGTSSKPGPSTMIGGGGSMVGSSPGKAGPSGPVPAAPAVAAPKTDYTGLLAILAAGAVFAFMG